MALSTHEYYELHVFNMETFSLKDALEKLQASEMVLPSEIQRAQDILTYFETRIANLIQREKEN